MDGNTLSQKFKQGFDFSQLNLQGVHAPRLMCNGLHVTKPPPPLYRTTVSDDVRLCIGGLCVKEPMTNEIECSQQ